MYITAESARRMEIARQVAGAYSELDGIDSLAVSGSTARGNADEFSDIDILMTYSSMPDEDQRLSVLERLDDLGSICPMSTTTNGMTRAEALVVSGVEIGLLPGRNEDLLSVGADIEQCIGGPSEVGVADIHDCIVLYDPKGLYASVRSRLAGYSIPAGTRVINSCLGSLVRCCGFDMPRAYRSRNWPEMLIHVCSAQEHLLRIVFALNRDYFPRIKDAVWLLPSMRHLPECFTNDLLRSACTADAVEARSMLVSLAIGLADLAAIVWPENLDGEIVSRLHGIPSEPIPSPQ